jgi:hypothetical protein
LYWDTGTSVLSLAVNSTPSTLAINNSGNVGIGTTNPGTKLAVSGLTGTASYNLVRVDTATGNFYYDTSTQKSKEDIQTFGDDFSKILEIEPKSFIDKASGLREIGFIAEDFDALGLNKLVIYGEDGLPVGLKYEKIPLYILQVVKEQQKEIKALEQSLNASSTPILGGPPSSDEVGPPDSEFEIQDSGLTLGAALEGQIKEILADWGIQVKEFGHLVVEKLTAAIVTVKELVIDTAAANPTIGEAVFPARFDTFKVENTSVHPNSKIFITFRGDLRGRTFYIAGQGEGWFEVKLSIDSIEDLPFDYWIVQTTTASQEAEIRNPNTETRNNIEIPNSNDQNNDNNDNDTGNATSTPILGSPASQNNNGEAGPQGGPEVRPLEIKGNASSTPEVIDNSGGNASSSPEVIPNSD